MCNWHRACCGLALPLRSCSCWAADVPCWDLLCNCQLNCQAGLIVRDLSFSGRVGQRTSSRTKEIFPALGAVESLVPMVWKSFGAVLGAAVLDPVSQPSSNLHSWGFVSLKVSKSERIWDLSSSDLLLNSCSALERAE